MLTLPLKIFILIVRETGAGPRGERSKIIPTDHGEVYRSCQIYEYVHKAEQMYELLLSN